MQLNALTPHTKRRTAVRIGRGGKRGKTSGRGHKGQKARAGHKIRPAARDIIKRLPKLRGHGKNRARTVNSGRVRPQIVNIATLEDRYVSGDAVNPKTLVAKGILTKKSGRYPAVKILGNGTVTISLTVTNCAVSASAKSALEACGGVVTL